MRGCSVQESDVLSGLGYTVPRECIHCLFISHSSVSGYLSCFHILAIVSSAKMNIAMYVSFQIIGFSRYMPRSDVVDHMVTYLVL